MTDQELRRRVLEAARPLFAEGGRPSLEKVARRAGISRTTLYRLFESRERLVQALRLEPDPDARQKVLEAAETLVGERGLAALGMDELAERAGVSRATLYRLFPGKQALLRALLVSFTPLEVVAAAVERMAERPPAEVMPEVAVIAMRALSAHPGLILELLRALVGGDADMEEVARGAAARLLGSGGAYVAGQMMA